MTSRKYRDPKSFQPPAGSELIHQVLIDHHELIKPFITSVSADYTTTGNAGLEIVDCTNTASITITLHTPIKDGQQVLVKKSSTGAVTIATAGSETIDADASVSLTGDSGLHLYAIEPQTKWMKN